MSAFIIGNVPHLGRGMGRAAYRLAGQGQRQASLTFDPALIPDPRAWLEARIGPLAAFELEQPPAREEPVMPPPKPPTLQEGLPLEAMGLRRGVPRMPDWPGWQRAPVDLVIIQPGCAGCTLEVSGLRLPGRETMTHVIEGMYALRALREAS